MPKEKQAFAHADTVIRSVWQTLGEVRRVLFTSESGPKSRMRWSGKGAGSVCVDTRVRDIRFAEQGSFLQTNSTREIPFEARWHWELKEHRLRLYHERHGVDSPVFLCDFVACDTTSLICENPHLCNADTYRCTLTLTKQGLDAVWLITGPGKDERLEYHYLIE